MNIGAVLIVLPSPLLRDALARILRDVGATMIHEASDLDNALSCLRSLKHDGPDLVILDAALCNERANAIGSVQEEGGRARLVLLGYDINAISSDNVLVADGILTFDITANMMIRSLRLIQKGERVVPRELMQAILRSRESGSHQPAAPAQTLRLGRSQAPSPREAEILERLMRGHSNKTIARELGITETTVKVHLKSLLRKINASNRTQAAIWALNNGYGAETGSDLFTTVGPVTDAEVQAPVGTRSRWPRRN
jgi:two-component system, NarL family, nitrate/nitrite response regulator NarL